MTTPYTQPVKVGDKLHLEVINLGEKGDGVAKHKDFVILIPEGEIGKKYRVTIRKVFEKFAISDISREVKQIKTKRNNQ